MRRIRFAATTIPKENYTLFPILLSKIEIQAMNNHLDRRIVITGVGLVSPNADNPVDFRRKLLHGISEIQEIDLRYFGKAAAGICTFDETRHRKKRKTTAHPRRLHRGLLRPRGPDGRRP